MTELQEFQKWLDSCGFTPVEYLENFGVREYAMGKGPEGYEFLLWAEGPRFAVAAMFDDEGRFQRFEYSCPERLFENE